MCLIVNIDSVGRRVSFHALCLDEKQVIILLFTASATNPLIGFRFLCFIEGTLPLRCICDADSSTPIPNIWRPALHLSSKLGESSCSCHRVNRTESWLKTRKRLNKGVNEKAVTFSTRAIDSGNVGLPWLMGLNEELTSICLLCWMRTALLHKTIWVNDRQHNAVNIVHQGWNSFGERERENKITCHYMKTTQAYGNGPTNFQLAYI